jgi:hypothetical protein
MTRGLSQEQAEWLVTFFHNVPGTAQAAHATSSPNAYQAEYGTEYTGQEVDYDYECFPIMPKQY